MKILMGNLNNEEKIANSRDEILGVQSPSGAITSSFRFPGRTFPFTNLFELLFLLTPCSHTQAHFSFQASRGVFPSVCLFACPSFCLSLSQIKSLSLSMSLSIFLSISLCLSPSLLLSFPLSLFSEKNCRRNKKIFFWKSAFFSSFHLFILDAQVFTLYPSFLILAQNLFFPFAIHPLSEFLSFPFSRFRWRATRNPICGNLKKQGRIRGTRCAQYASENNAGRTDGRTYGPTDRRTDGRTHPLIEMRRRI